MAQEEHILSSSHSGSGGGGGGSGGGGGPSSNRSKNVKQKKVPQRGLGVAQLEKIRLEEQRKREALQAANVLANNAIGSASDTAPCLAVQCPSFGPSLSHSPNSVPLPPSPTNFPSPNALYRSAPSVPIQITNQLNGGGGEIGLQTVSSPGNGSMPRLWNSEYNLEGEKQRVDHLGFAFGPQVNLQYESNAPVLPLPSVPQRSYQFQRPPSPVVNASSGISPSSVLSSQMEPPSNQSLRGNNYTSLRPEEDKMVGMKRSYPFSLESPPAPSFPGNFQPTYAAPRSRSDELPSCSSGYTAQMEPRNKYMRNGPSNSSTVPERNPSDVMRDDGRLNGDFLTLAPPAAASPPLNSKHKHPSDYSGHQGPDLSDFKCLPNQENLKSQIHQLGPSGSKEQPFSFFPIKSQVDQTTTRVSSGNGEKGEKIDLSLKL
ncbi:hypothetical protein Pfo_014057 [Paulownia fortunei]|nr:hypothetical protein Pfo_014057 [Paulownia fortunei]